MHVIIVMQKRHPAMSYQQGLDDDVDIEEGRSPSPPDYHNARSLSPPVYSDAINDVLLLKGTNMYFNFSNACVHDVCLMYSPMASI